MLRKIILMHCATLRERIVRCLPFDAFTLLPQVVEEIEESKFNVKLAILICVFRNLFDLLKIITLVPAYYFGTDFSTKC